METANPVNNPAEELKHRISGCFGEEDGIFGSGNDRPQAAEAIREYALRNKIPLNEIGIAASDFLREKGYSEEHIMKETARVEEFFAYRNEAGFEGMGKGKDFTEEHKDRPNISG